MRYQLRPANLAILAMIFSSSAAPAGQITSEYTKIIFPGQTARPANCIDISPPATDEQSANYGKWTCRGYKDWAVDVAFGDGRYSLYFRPASAPVIDYWQTLTGVHSIGKTLEWRLEGGRPFAAILRHYPEWDDTGLDIKKSQTLVVWKVSESVSCHVAYVDVRGNANANVKARNAADMLARGFDCAKDKITYIGPVQ